MADFSDVANSTAWELMSHRVIDFFWDRSRIFSSVRFWSIVSIVVHYWKKHLQVSDSSSHQTNPMKFCSSDYVHIAFWQSWVWSYEICDNYKSIRLLLWLAYVKLLIVCWILAIWWVRLFWICQVVWVTDVDLNLPSRAQYPNLQILLFYVGGLSEGLRKGRIGLTLVSAQHISVFIF
jgi:hypothetical protein